MSHALVEQVNMSVRADIFETVRGCAWAFPLAAFKILLFLGGLSHLALADSTPGAIAINQLGYLPHSSKVAVVANPQSGEFWLMSAQTDEEVLRGPLSDLVSAPEFGGKTKVADFSAFNKPGDYYLRVRGVGRSEAFTIGAGRYDKALVKVANTFYLHRAGIAIEDTFAGAYARPAGHPDLVVYAHDRVKTKRGRLFSSPRGWYDSGDYNKHTVNTAYTLYFLLRTLHLYGNDYAKLDLNIPESVNALPDLLDEIVWGLDWLLTVQDVDGGVFQRLGGTESELKGLPSQQHDRRYLLQKTTLATLHFAAVTAYASEVLGAYPLPQLSETLKAASERAWKWSKKNPRVVFSQPPGVSSQIYAWTNDDLRDEWSWAAAELASATGSRSYLKDLQLNKGVVDLRWQDVEVLALVRLAQNSKLKQTERQQIQALLTDLADGYVRQYWKSGYLVPMEVADFERGSNYLAVNKAFTLLEVYRIVARAEYLDAARAVLDYLMGRNPLYTSYVTQVGSRAPQHPRDWISQFDRLDIPLPGMLVGGPYAEADDKCQYAAIYPAGRYADSWCSEQTNHVSLAGSAALLYVLSKLREDEKPH